MTESKTPDAHCGTSGVSHAGSQAEARPSHAPGTSANWTALFGKPIFWIALVGTAWLLPLFKGLGGEFPDPPPGSERQPESFDLIDLEGRRVQTTDLAGYLLVILPLSLANESELESGFKVFRELKSHLRHLGSTVAYILLVHGAERDALGAFVESKKARKPNNIFLFDTNGATHERLCESASLEGAQVLLLDRHGRLRGAFSATDEDQQRLFRSLTLLSNWEGCDPALGAPIHH